MKQFKSVSNSNCERLYGGTKCEFSQRKLAYAMFSSCARSLSLSLSLSLSCSLKWAEMGGHHERMQDACRVFIFLFASANLRSRVFSLCLSSLSRLFSVLFCSPPLSPKRRRHNLEILVLSLNFPIRCHRVFLNAKNCFMDLSWLLNLPCYASFPRGCEKPDRVSSRCYSFAALL